MFDVRHSNVECQNDTNVKHQTVPHSNVKGQTFDVQHSNGEHQNDMNGKLFVVCQVQVQGYRFRASQNDSQGSGQSQKEFKV